jgi:hypothetical protein
MTAKLALTALLALAAGVGGTYATIRVTATCLASPAGISGDGMKSFLAKPDAPLTGYPTYK